jgi:hypothetical protein
MTFILTPQLFSHFDHRLAGEITNLLFPIYFASGWIIGIVIYTLIALQSIKDKFIVKRLKGFVIALTVLILLYMAEHKTLLPIGQQINSQYYALLDEGKKDEAQIFKEKFKKVHMISSSINILNLLLLLYLFYSYLSKKEEKEL